MSQLIIIILLSAISFNGYWLVVFGMGLFQVLTNTGVLQYWILIPFIGFSTGLSTSIWLIIDEYKELRDQRLQIKVVNS